MVHDDFYVDDLTTGVDDVEEGFIMYKKVKIRFLEAQFNVRKWRTNSKELRNKMESQDILSEENGKVLGIKWNNYDDTLQLRVKEIFSSAGKMRPTKRNVLKVIAAIYDPLGILAPITITLKILFQ